MSLQQLAHHTASAGRHGDSMLMHMAPQEVAGLQALALKHGTSLTVNPHTGLPEAFKLKSLLPMLAGVALGPAGFGLMSAGMAGLTVGGLSALSSGSLSKGLMDGLSAYGASNLASGFSDVGKEAAANGALSNLGPNASTEAAMSASKNAIAEASKSPFSTIGSGISESFSDPSKFKTAMGGLGNIAGAALPVVGPMLADEATPTVTKMPSNGYIRNFDYDPMTQRAKALDPVSVSSLGYAEGGTIGAPKTITQMPGNTMTGASRAAFDYLIGLNSSSNPPPIDLGGQTAPNPIPKSANVDTSMGRYVWDATTNSYKWVDSNNPLEAKAAVDAAPVDMNPVGAADSGGASSSGAVGDGDGGPSGDGSDGAGGSVGDGSGDGGAAAGDGGAAAGDGGGAGGGDGAAAASDAHGGFYNNGKFDQRPKGIERLASGGMPMYAQGGLGQLGGYSDGGQLLKGPGDGVSDSIPATIGNKQPARLADGEFVVPARIVSELGNGSTEAGARKLYQMMDRIQATRSKTMGKGRVAKNSRAEKHLPG